MRSTIKQVAEKSGVSIATVSRVFNDSELVEEETKKKVLRIADELLYSPNQIARSLSQNRTNAIGLLLPDLHGEFFSEVIRGVDSVVQKIDYHLLVSSSHNKKEEIQTALRMLNGRVDGLIIMSPNIDAETLHRNISKSLPVVLLNCFINDTTFDSINIDNFNGAYMIVKHLIQHGHSRIAIIKGNESNYDAHQRLDGYKAAMKDAGLSELTFEICGDFTQSSGYDAVKIILERQERPTAIFASNDSMAIGAMSALKEHGIEIPSEMAIVGFDDIPVAQYLQPRLTTVRIDVAEYGAQAMERLNTFIQERMNHIRHHTVLMPQLSIRDSCGTHVEDNL